MKKILFFFFFPLVSFAICQECDSFRSSLLTRNQDITSEVQGMQGDADHIINWSASISNSTSDSNAKSLADQIYTQAVVLQSRASITLDMLASNRVEILAFNCDCDSSSGCECSGVLTNIYESLQYIEGYSRETSYGMETLLHDLETFKSAVVDGFVNVSNQLSSVILSIDSIFTNRVSFSLSTSGVAPFYRAYYWYQGSNGNESQVGDYYLRPGRASSISDAIKVMAAGVPYALYSLNNWQYDFISRSFPVLTNTVGTLTRESTNFFSFFRAQIGVNGVLEDWTEQDGSYYDFLTNHYIQAVTGGTLSGNQSSKTNWFARVETLLASLVFADAETTNTVDASENQELKEQISSSFHELTEGPQNGMIQTLDDVTPNVIAQVRRFSSVFSSASMPSRVTLYSSDGEEGFKIAFDISGDSVYYDLFRNVTTLCWALIGLFVVYRFLVWSITQIVNLVYFCFNVFTDIFKAR